MDFYEWAVAHLETIATVGSVCSLYFMLKGGLKKDFKTLKNISDSNHVVLKTELFEMKKEIKELKQEFTEMNTRVARIEGNLFGPQLYRGG